MKDETNSRPPLVVEICESGAHDDVVALSYDERLVRRKRLVAEGGQAFRVDFPRATELPDKSVLRLDTGTRILVQAAEEDLLDVSGSNLALLAWHIGNRHTPCELSGESLRIRFDPVLRDMLIRLGAKVVPLRDSFRPEGGAYGMGRTFAHDHGHSH